MLNHSAVPHQVRYSLIPLLSYLHDCFTLFFPVLNAGLFQQPMTAHQFMSLRKKPFPVPTYLLKVAGDHVPVSSALNAPSSQGPPGPKLGLTQQHL